MKVLVYLHYYPPYRWVGGELMTADLLEHLVGAGHTVHVYAEHIHTSYERNGVFIRNAGHIHMNRANTYDVFLTHPEVRMMVWHDVQRLPYAGIVHNTDIGTMRSIERRPPDLCIANSGYTARRLPRTAHLTDHGVHVMHPPVTIQGGKATPKHVVMVNISPQKGGYVLQHVARANPTIQFVAVAGGHGEQVWDQPPNVTLVSQGADMHTIYSEARALMFPSQNETYGKVVAEATQYGVPIIASDLPGIREAGGDAPTYLRPMDFTAWDHWVNELQNPDVHRAMSAVSKARGEHLRAQTQRDLIRFERLLEGLL